jgi:hypothetical protein
LLISVKADKLGELHGPLQNFDLAAEGYTRLMHWRIFGHEGLAKTGVALWLGSDALSLEHAGESLL